jgi:hypothetical protein
MSVCRRPQKLRPQAAQVETLARSDFHPLPAAGLAGGDAELAGVEALFRRLVRLGRR